MNHPRPPLTEEEIKQHADRIRNLMTIDKHNVLFYGTPIDSTNNDHVIAAAYSLGCKITEHELIQKMDAAKTQKIAMVVDTYYSGHNATVH